MFRAGKSIEMESRLMVAGVCGVTANGLLLGVVKKF